MNRFDYQTVRLVALTRPLGMPQPEHLTPQTYEEYDAEDFISYCARVSNPANQTNFDTGAKLLNYCARNAHWSIFEMANMCLEIQTTRDIGRQILRHGSFRFQEFSQRYAKVDKPFVTRETRFQHPTNRQKSVSVEYMADNPSEIAASVDFIDQEWRYRQAEVAALVAKHYQWAIDHSIAKEQARAILPEGMTMSCMYVNGNIRSWIHFCQVRTGNGTQDEHIDIATKARNILLAQFPSLEPIFNQ